MPANNFASLQAPTQSTATAEADARASAEAVADSAQTSKPATAGRPTYVVDPNTVTEEVASGGFKVLSAKIKRSMAIKDYVTAAQTRQQLNELMATPGGEQYLNNVETLAYGSGRYLDEGTRRQLLSMTPQGLEEDLLASGMSLKMLDNRKGEAYWLAEGATPDDAQAFAALSDLAIPKDPESAQHQIASAKMRIFNKNLGDPGKGYGQIRQYEANIQQFQQSFRILNQDNEPVDTAASRAYADRAYDIVGTYGVDPKVATRLITWSRQNAPKGDGDNKLAPSEFAMSMLEQVASVSGTSPEAPAALNAFLNSGLPIDLSGGAAKLVGNLKNAAPLFSDIDNLSGWDDETKSLMIKALGVNSGLIVRNKDTAQFEARARARAEKLYGLTALGVAAESGDPAQMASTVQAMPNGAIAGLVEQAKTSPTAAADVPATMARLSTERAVNQKMLENSQVPVRLAKLGAVVNDALSLNDRLRALREYVEETPSVGDAMLTGEEAEFPKVLAAAEGAKTQNWKKRVPKTVLNPGAIGRKSKERIVETNVSKKADSLAAEVGQQVKELLYQMANKGWDLQETLDHAKGIKIVSAGSGAPITLADFLNTPTGETLFAALAGDEEALKSSLIPADKLTELAENRDYYAGQPIGLKLPRKLGYSIAEGVKDLGGAAKYAGKSIWYGDPKAVYKGYDPHGFGASAVNELLNSQKLDFNEDAELIWNTETPVLAANKYTYAGKTYDLSTDEGKLAALDAFGKRLLETGTNAEALDKIKLAGEMANNVYTADKELNNLSTDRRNAPLIAKLALSQQNGGPAGPEQLMVTGKVLGMMNSPLAFDAFKLANLQLQATKEQNRVAQFNVRQTAEQRKSDAYNERSNIKMNDNLALKILAEETAAADGERQSTNKPEDVEAARNWLAQRWAK